MHVEDRWLFQKSVMLQIFAEVSFQTFGGSSSEKYLIWLVLILQSPWSIHTCMHPATTVDWVPLDAENDTCISWTFRWKRAPFFHQNIATGWKWCWYNLATKYQKFEECFRGIIDQIMPMMPVKSTIVFLDCAETHATILTQLFLVLHCNKTIPMMPTGVLPVRFARPAKISISISICCNMVLLTWNRTASKCVSSNNFDYWFWQFSCFAHNFAERFVANQRFCGHLHSWQVPFFSSSVIEDFRRC